MGMYGEPRKRVTCGPGRTKQSMKAECDINNILARYKKTGFLSHVAQGVPVFADVSEVADYRTAIANVRDAQKWFGGMPANVRARFDHDVANFMDFMLDPANKEEAIRLGLAQAEKKPAPEPAGPAVTP